MEETVEVRKESDVIGLGWEHTSSTGIPIINLAINQDKISYLPEDKFGSVRLKLIKFKVPNEKSNATHKVVVDRLWKIDKNDSI